MMSVNFVHIQLSTFFVLFSCFYEIYGSNLTCYQCIKNTNTECLPHELLPCPPISDRCVTFISKDIKKGFSIKRECGLGPCEFRDVMVNKGLGLDNCDRSRNEYFCLFCCKENGCNKSDASVHPPSSCLLVMLFIFICLLNIFKQFQPPYVPQDQ